jgi:hypothetical protein
VITVTILAAALLGSVVVGLTALLSVGIAHEERNHSMLGQPATRAAAVTRQVVGLYVRAPEYTACQAAHESGCPR